MTDIFGNPEKSGTGIAGAHSARMINDEWLTPPEIIRALGTFDLDPCAPIRRPWPTATRHFTIEDNGLLQPWSGRVWCNPPYGKETGRWLTRCADHRNATVLIFARTETGDWKNHVWPRADAVLFIFGRLHFFHVDGRRARQNAGGPSALISYDPENTEALRRSGIEGRLVKL